MTLALPWPPSVNHYWVRTRNGGMRVSDRGVTFRNTVTLLIGAAGLGGNTRLGRLSVRLCLWQPDARRRDVDNICKATLDALAHAGVYGDDSQIDVLHVERLGVDRTNPRVNVELSEL